MRRLISALCSTSFSVRSVSANTLSFIRQRHKRISPAITLVELLIVLAIVGTLAAIGVPSYNNYIDKTRISQAIEDIYAIQKGILLYVTEHAILPDNLDQAIWPRRLDPWGHSYEYLKIEGKPKSEVAGKWRKDRFLVPLNTDYDLYSMGKDGESKSPLTAKVSRDDIVRANNGAFVELASEY